jgi:hypothetical protein
VFINKTINFHDKPITLSKLAQIANKNINDVVREVKSRICVICQSNVIDKNISSGDVYQLPCNCILCSKQCISTYFSTVFNKKRIKIKGI